MELFTLGKPFTQSMLQGSLVLESYKMQMHFIIQKFRANLRTTAFMVHLSHKYFNLP